MAELQNDIRLIVQLGHMDTDSMVKVTTILEQLKCGGVKVCGEVNVRYARPTVLLLKSVVQTYDRLFKLALDRLRMQRQVDTLTKSLLLFDEYFPLNLESPVYDCNLPLHKVQVECAHILWVLYTASYNNSLPDWILPAIQQFQQILTPTEGKRQLLEVCINLHVCTVDFRVKNSSVWPTISAVYLPVTLIVWRLAVSILANPSKPWFQV
jgi:hypothetical protein